MSLLRLYFKALLFQNGYIGFTLILWTVALVGRGVPIDAPMTPLVFVFLALLITNLSAPRHVLRLPEAIENLPYTREKIALLTFAGLTLALIPMFMILWGFDHYLLFYGMSLALISALHAKTLGALLFLPFVFTVPWLKCESYRIMTLFLFVLPYVVVLALYVTRKTGTLTFHGLHYAPRYALSAILVLLLFEAFYTQLKTPMRFVVSQRMIGVDQPEFTLLFPVLLLMFMVWAYLPFLNVLSLRHVEHYIAFVRFRLTTPWQKRALALGVALFLNLPVGILMLSVRYVEIDWKSLLNMLILGAWMNTIVPNGENHPAMNYTSLIYLAALNFTPLLSPGIVLTSALVSTLILYDMDRILWPRKHSW